MANRIVVGVQWGDEGKAKIVDYLTEKSDIVVRFQGGANAGHTVVVQDKKFIFHLLPAGILYPGKACVIGNGVVFDPEEFFKEIDSVNKEGISVAGRLFVSDRAHIVMPYHRELDRARENASAGKKIGTTGRGIGPAYADKAARIGIRVADLYSPATLREKIDAALFEKNHLFAGVYGTKAIEAGEMCAWLELFAGKLKPYVTDTSVLLNDQMRKYKSILFEGAQGTFLDIDHGTYPFVTSSTTAAGGACGGAGVGPTRIDEVVGVVKAYTTRVGNGPFPTEFDEKTGNKIREMGDEFGATTGRPRRCGWLDAVMLCRGVELSGLDTMVITKLDVLDTLDEVKIATSYKVAGKTVRTFPASLLELEKLAPVYETLPGWKVSTCNCTRFEDLPEHARRYVQRIEELTKTKVSLVSVGPRRDQTLEVK